MNHSNGKINIRGSVKALGKRQILKIPRDGTYSILSIRNITYGVALDTGRKFNVNIQQEEIIVKRIS